MDNSEILKLMGIPKRLETGFYCSMILNTKGKGCPQYVVNYFSQLFKDSFFTFDVRTIFDQRANIKDWQQEYPNIADTDTILQVLFTFNTLGLTGKVFEEYAEAIINSDIVPFVVGCNFDFVGMHYICQTPTKYQNLGQGGDHSITIYSKEMSNELYEIFKNVFAIDEGKIAEADNYFDMLGEYKLDKCVDGENLPKLETWMNTMGIKYEIE